MRSHPLPGSSGISDKGENEALSWKPFIGGAEIVTFSRLSPNAGQSIDKRHFSGSFAQLAIEIKSSPKSSVESHSSGLLVFVVVG
jgi:hypothetical protein